MILKAENFSLLRGAEKKPKILLMVGVISCFIKETISSGFFFIFLLEDNNRYGIERCFLYVI